QERFLAMPPLDWIHVAMFAAGLVLQFVAHRSGVIPAISPPPSPPAPATGSAPAASTDSKPLLDLVHKLLDQRQPASPQLDPQTLQALMSVVNKLIDQPSPPTPVSSAKP